ncbi:hypothetical protein FRE64_09150 [Euhalothece natronophila Z-M001]|uniref:Uncharacterized protein n=1 Tax=Euhalothece natronophila Z-M001 TaxID=522448 RepID=A0A5B8NM25_9CHRO|nr:hypothetical protein [Euhalothece natronophila]QDZ40094.1 hypothetical protein FRE64_09150 [Euhalothece natronophila Z-M001]
MTDTNKKINELKREMQRLYEDVKALKVDIEPGGHVSEGFDRLSEDIDNLRDEVRKNYYQHSHQINQVLARQEVMLEAFTKISDLPEED